MSSRESLPLRLSLKAQQDFIDILCYTGRTWGEKQLLAYRDKIDGALQAISRNPQIGHSREDLPPTHAAYLVGSHLIIYRSFDVRIDIVRILHRRMSVARQV